MSFKLSPASLEAAITHLCRYGDTDIFPHLPELAFFADEKKAIVAELAKLDLNSYSPSGAFEALAPKNRYGFRIAHQLAALDTVLLLSCVIEIGPKIEEKRQQATQPYAFSYRFALDAKTGQLFRSDRTFKHWLHTQQEILKADKKIKHVVTTDISDFYSRINFHRLENLLDEVAPGHAAAKFIKRHIKVIRGKQSFGLPVGGSAARLLAELALTDTDQALRDRGLQATRFVDDFRILLANPDSPYDALGCLAEQLGINEGLSLNVAKTSVLSRLDYVRRLDRLTTDVAKEAEGVALDVLTADLYFDDEPDPEALEKLKGVNLVALLEAEIKAPDWDMGRVKVLFRALKIAKPADAITLIENRFDELVIFAKDICLLMEVLANDNPSCFDDLLDEVIEAVLAAPASSIQLIRTWLLELFVRGTVKIPLEKIKKMEGLPTLLDKRQLLLIRGRVGDKNYFRKHKTAIHHFSESERDCLLWGASCLPKDEYEKWLDSLRSTYDKPLGGLFLKWLSKNRTKLVSKLSATTDDHPT